MNAAALIFVSLVCISAGDEPKAVDLADQKAMIVIKPGETKEVILCWKNVPGGRAPDIALNDKSELNREERNRLRTVEKYESHGVTVTLDFKRAGEIATRLLEHDHDYWMVAAIKVEAGPQAKPGVVNFYVHYAAGTGRFVYRRGAICVLVEKL
jgi:hypothetical protein